MSFDDETLRDAKDCRVEIAHVEKAEIIARVDEFEVTAPIVFQSPHHVFCSCKSKYPCRHQAALKQYLERHPELLKNTDLISTVDESMLREFLREEMKQNPQLKKDFQDLFAKNPPVDRQHYMDRLDRVFQSGQDRYLADIGVYDIDRMEYGLSEFMEGELSQVLDAGEHSLACTLVERIAEVLGDDLAVSHDSWYDLAEDLMEYVYILEDSIYISADERESLERAVGEIVSYL